ncbi:MAG TPA: hypothetical protein VG943_13415 [Caulobacterales bacterium]|nr:hypothetical protein [Caulobacterales bacterium]
MVDRTDNATPWMAFLIGIIVVALIVVGYFALNGAPQQTAQLEPQQQPSVINVQPPTVNVAPPASTTNNYNSAPANPPLDGSASTPSDNTAPADNNAPANTTP